MFLRLIRYLVSVSLCSFIVFPNALLADYSKNDKAIQMIEELVKDHGFDKAELISLFSEAERKESILEAISRPAEKRLEWFEYRKIFITKDRIKKGHAFLEQYAEVLTRAESEFGVPKEIITAIIGVETRYGSNKGSYRVLDALATLGFDYPPRAKFFSSELKQALNSLEKDNLKKYEASLRKVISSLKRLDKEVGMHMEDIINSTKVKKASNIHRHGLSVGRAADLLGISKWELMPYSGQTRTYESRYNVSKSVKERLLLARRLFGIK